MTQELDIVRMWTRANEPLPQAVLSYVISPLPSAGGMPQAWSMVRGRLDYGEPFVAENADVRFEVWFAHGLTGEQVEAAVASFQAACERRAGS